MRSRSRHFVLGSVALVATAFAVFADEQGQIDFANGLYSRGFYSEAAAEYRTYVKQYPEGAQRLTALYRLGESESGAGNHEAALKAFDQVLAAKPADDVRQRALLRKGVALYQLRRLGDAAQVLEPLAKEELPEALRTETLYYLGKLYFDGARHDAAAAAFKEILHSAASSPLVPYARYQLAFVYLAQNNLENAATEFSGVANIEAADQPLRMECRFRAAETYDKLGWFEQAVTAYEQLRREFPGSEYARRASYGYAWSLYHAAKYPGAIEASQAFLKEFAASPEAPGVKYLLANCLQQQRRFDEALAAYANIRSEHPDTDFARRAQYKTAWVHYLTGNAAQSKAEATAFLAAAGTDPLAGDAAFLLGNLLLAEGDFAGAQPQFVRVVEQHPQSEFAPEALYKSAECLTQLGKTAEAAEAYQQFAAKYPDNPLAGDAILRAGDADFHGGDFNKAVEKYVKILEESPGPDIEEDTMYRLALAYHNLKSIEESTRAFRVLLEKYPNSKHASEAQVRIGEYWLREGKDAVKAIEFFEAAHNANPKGPFGGRALKGLALARFESKDLDGAAEVFSQVIENYPELALTAETYAWVGQHQFDRGEFPLSAKAFDALLKTSPNYPNKERILFKIAESIEQSGDAAAAFKRYEAVAKAAPDSTLAIDARYRMAKALEAQKQTDKAIVLYEDAANANSGDTAAQARFRLGEIHEAKGEFAEAARHFMRVAILFLHPELTPESLLRAGSCYEQNKEPDQAAKTYQELVRDHPDSPQAAKAKERLAALAG